MIGDGVESMLLLDFSEEDEECLSSGGEPAEDTECVLWNCGCLKRLGRASLGEKEVREDIEGSLCGGGEDDDCFCLCTNDGQSLSFRIEKTRPRLFR